VYVRSFAAAPRARLVLAQAQPVKRLTHRRAPTNSTRSTRLGRGEFGRRETHGTSRRLKFLTAHCFGSQPGDSLGVAVAGQPPCGRRRPEGVKTRPRLSDDQKVQHFNVLKVVSHGSVFRTTAPFPNESNPDQDDSSARIGAFSRRQQCDHERHFSQRIPRSRLRRRR
jgi:hypothetical protein